MRQIAVEILVAASVGFLLGLLGPFGSYAMPMAYRMAYWVLFAIIGYMLFRPITLVASWLAEASVVPLWLCRIVAVAIAALPMSWIVAYAMNGMSLPNEMAGRWFVWLYLQVAGIGAAIYALTVFLFPRDQDEGANAVTLTEDSRQIAINPQIIAASQEQEPPALAKRLSPGFALPVLALTVEDHYVRAHNATSSEMLLMRLSDAMTEMESVPGLQVHRSWWVADGAVTGARSVSRNIRLQLSNGLEVPVSRANISSVRARGWLENMLESAPPDNPPDR